MERIIVVNMPLSFFGGDKKSKRTMYRCEKGDLLITNISITFIVDLLSLRDTSRVACFFSFCAFASLLDLA